MPDEAQIPDAFELLAFGEHLLLAESVDVLTIGGSTIGSDDVQPIVVLRITARVNHSEERRTINVAWSPAGMAETMRTVVASYSGAAGPRNAFGQREDR